MRIPEQINRRLVELQAFRSNFPILLHQMIPKGRDKNLLFSKVRRPHVRLSFRKILNLGMLLLGNLKNLFI